MHQLSTVFLHLYAPDTAAVSYEVRNFAPTPQTVRFRARPLQDLENGLLETRLDNKVILVGSTETLLPPVLTSLCLALSISLSLSALVCGAVCVCVCDGLRIDTLTQVESASQRCRWNRRRRMYTASGSASWSRAFTRSTAAACNWRLRKCILRPPS